MNRVIEIGTMVFGGASLLLVAFLGFAVVSGVPLHEVALVGCLFAPPEPPVDGHVEAPATPAPAAEHERPDAETTAPRADAPFAAGSTGLTAAYGLPAPYTQAELDELVQDLKERALGLDRRKARLDRREQALADREDDCQARMASLKDLQERLDAFQEDLLAREQRVSTDEARSGSADSGRYARLGQALAGLDAGERAGLLARYEPDEAARIVLGLPGDQRPATMAALSRTLPATRAKEYVEAYSRAADRVQ